MKKRSFLQYKKGPDFNVVPQVHYLYLRACHKRKKEPKTSYSDLTELGMTNKQPTWKKDTTLLMDDSIFSGLREYEMSR